MLVQTITTSLTNYAAVLTELKTVAPEAHVFLPGYYNPFPAAIDPTDHAFYDMVLGAFNPGLQGLAGSFGATYVDLYKPFVGRELALTNIATGDFHPNQAGYDVIGSAFIAAAVPEPSSLTSLGLAVISTGLACLARKRYRARRSAA
jgi:lysophospholipase L1-like esterase